MCNRFWECQRSRMAVLNSKPLVEGVDLLLQARHPLQTCVGAGNATAAKLVVATPRSSQLVDLAGFGC